MLTPDGNYGMDSEFLVSFMKSIELPDNYIIPSKVNRREIVEREICPKTDTTGGRKDIIIEDGHNAIIIENKIYATDQENQLLCYYNNAMEKFGEGHFVLLYLNLDGHEPSEFSTNNEDIAYKCISYSEDIIAWLSQCVKTAYNRPLIRETMTQYINLLKQLTGKDMDKEQIDEVTKLALDNLEAASILMGVKDDVAQSLLNTYLIPRLVDFAKENGLDFTHADDNSWYEFKKPNWESSIKVKSDRGKWKNMYIGINDLRKEKPISNLTCLSGRTTGWWPLWLEYASVRRHFISALFQTY